MPTNFSTSVLPTVPTGLLREHRLYQADWLLRFYGFSADEILDEGEDLDLSIDPKCHWALKNPSFFPVEINKAPFETLIRVPGIGFTSASKIVAARKFGSLGFEDLCKMRVVLKRAVHFITCKGAFFGKENPSAVRLLLTMGERRETATQLNMFSSPEITSSVLLGQL